MTTTIVTQQAFRPHELGLFDPKESAAAIEVKDNKNTYHDVRTLTRRLRVSAQPASKTELAAICRGLPGCFLGAAANWFTESVNSETQSQLLGGDTASIELWCSLLEGKFRPSTTQARAALDATRYTIHDARQRQDPAEYVLAITQHYRNAHPESASEPDIVRAAYTNIKGILRMTLPWPAMNAMINEFTNYLNKQKHVWFDARQLWSAGGYNMNTLPRQWPPDHVQNDYTPPGKPLSQPQSSLQPQSSSKNCSWPPKYPHQALPASGPKAYKADAYDSYQQG